jgi:hypothetical protein
MFLMVIFLAMFLWQVLFDNLSSFLSDHITFFFFPSVAWLLLWLLEGVTVVMTNYIFALVDSTMFHFYPVV